MIRVWVQVLGPATTLIGVLLSVSGTYLLTRWYHPFKLKGFLGIVFRVTWLFITGQRDSAIQITRTATKLGRLNREKRAESLIGLYLIFVGFLFQAVGALLWGADTVWSLLKN